jgi:hypothetical protein
MTTVEEKKPSPQDAPAPRQNAVPPRKDPASKTFDGKVVSLTGNKLVMTNEEGKKYSKTLAKDAKLTCDGTDCKAEDLQVGRQIRVTTTKDDRNVATCIESLDKQAEFAQCS